MTVEVTSLYRSKLTTPADAVGCIASGVTLSMGMAMTSGTSKYVENISVGPHVLQADEPNNSGRNDAGPNP